MSTINKTVPEVLSTAFGRKTEGTFSPNTDRPGPVNNVFIFFLLRVKSFRKILLSLQPMCVEERRVRADVSFKARDRLQTKTKHDNMI